MDNSQSIILWILLVFLLSGCSEVQKIPKNDFMSVVEGLQIQPYGDMSNLESPTILIFLHGDGCVADYMKSLAKTVLRKNVISVIMARPGCSVSGRRSTGTHGKCAHYTESRIDAVTKSIYSIKKHFKAKRVYLIGHSGGAATAGIVIGRSPSLVDGIVAVAFPANISEWKAHREICGDWMNNLSPYDFVDNIRRSAQIYIANGRNDQNTPPELSKSYTDKATERGLNIENVVLEGEGHSSSLYAHTVWSTISKLTYIK